MFGSATSSYVRDVPIRLNKKFYPLPRRDGSYVIIDYPIRCPADILSEEYDFTVEKKALEDFQSNLQRPALNSYSNGYKADSSSYAENSCLGDSSSLASLNTVKNDGTSIPPALYSQVVDRVPFSTTSMYPRTAMVSPLRPLLTNGILQPTVVKASPARTDNVERATAGSGLHLEDFESVDCSPFDMVELKSINDIEELQRLWAQQQSKEYVS